MAEMEGVIINPEFIRSLERNRATLNAAYENFNSGDIRADSADVVSIFKRIVNPLYDNGIAVSDKALISIFKSILNLTSKKMIGNSGRYKNLEDPFLRITGRFKNLAAEHGGVFIINILNALLNLTFRKNISVTAWTDLILSLPADIDIDEFRKCGFVAAWISGAASAGERSMELIGGIRPEIIKILFRLDKAYTEAPENISQSIMNDIWSDPAQLMVEKKDTLPVFRISGGFRGYGYEFRALPIVAAIDNFFYATDGTTVFRLYADCYGVELLRENKIEPDEVLSAASSKKGISDGKLHVNGTDFELPPGWKTSTASIAHNSNTVVWSLNDSYKIFIAGIIKNHG